MLNFKVAEKVTICGSNLQYGTVPDGTLIRDFATYRIPFTFWGNILHSAIIRMQLQDIFSYRAVALLNGRIKHFSAKIDFIHIADIMKPC